MPEQDKKIMATQHSSAESRRDTWRYVHVEDNESEALLIEGVIRKAGYQPIMRRVETAGELSAALRLDKWDFILADWRLPSFSAMEALRVATHEAEGLPVIVVSGTVGEEVAVEAIKSGAHDYVMKDRLVRLVPAVEQALRELAERREHEQTRYRLEQSEEELQQAVTVAGLGLFRHNQLTDSLYWSPILRDILGVDADEPASLARFVDLMHPADRARVQAEIAQAWGSTGNGLFHSVYRVVRPDETIRWVQVHSKTLFDINMDGVRRPIRTIGAVADITQVKRTEKALQDTLTRFDLAVKGSRDGLWDIIAPDLHDPFNGDCPIYFSPRMKAILGIADGSFPDIVQTWTDLIHPDDRVRTFEALKRHFSERAPYDIEYRIIRPNGEHRWIVARGSAQWNENGEIGRMSGSITDITERKQTEAILYETSQQFAVAFSEAPIGMVLVSIDQKLLKANKTLARLLGYSEAELVGMSVLTLTHPENHREDVRVFEKLLANGDGGTLREKRCIHKDGHEVLVQASAALVRNILGKPEYFIVQVQDVTERKRAELALKHTEEQLLQAQKMEAIGLLAGGIAHDFNNLLTVIMGYADLQIRQMRQNKETTIKNLTSIVKAGERATWLTRQLLAFSRQQVMEPKVLDLNQVVSNFEKMLRRLIQENIILITRFEAVAPPVKVDPGQLEQVIMNLVINARDAMPNGGQLTIATRAVSVNNTRADCVPLGHYMCLSVCDNGHGMDAKTKERVFEPFFTTKEVGKGTGLGLSTVYGIVKQSHGFIEITSAPGQGTAIDVYFPVVTGEALNESQLSTHLPFQTGTETILVVDDAIQVRELMESVLSAAGYTVWVARNMDEALRIAEKEKWSMQLVVTDVIMPGGTGFDIGSQLKILCPGMKILYVSGYTRLEGVNQLIVETGGQLLQKPFTPNALLARVRDILDGVSEPRVEQPRFV